MDEVGRYVVAVQFVGSAMARGSRLNVDNANVEATVVVAARNGEQLRQECERWLGVVRSSASPGARNRAVAALTSMRDSSVVACLVDSALARGLAIEEVNALAAIPGAEATQGLGRLAKSSNPLTSQYASSALKTRAPSERVSHGAVLRR